MSVGFDFGNQNLVICVAQKGGLDIIENEAFNAQTPCMVSFTDKERAIGETGSTMFLRNVRNTVVSVKRLLGRKYNDPLVQEEIPRLPFRIVPRPATPQTSIVASISAPVEEDDIGIVVNYTNNETIFSPEQVVAMLLGKLKSTTEKSIGTKVKDVVISVPGYWTDRQRRAMIAAAEIADLHVLKLINEHSATALHSGFYKQDLEEKETRQCLLVDMGNSSTSVSVIFFTRAGLKVVATEFDPLLGGRSFDEVVAEHVAKQCTAKFGNLRTNPRAWQRLLAACEKQVKRVISSGNPKAMLSIENLANDMDLNIPFTRETFEDLIAPLLVKLSSLISSALTTAGIAPEAIHSVEVTGGGSRLSSVHTTIYKLFGRNDIISKTINNEESVARGAALQCAMLHPTFRVRDYKVEDTTPFPVKIVWNTYTPGSAGMEDQDSAVIIPGGTIIPAPKMISFARTSPIMFTAYYEGEKLPPGTEKEIGKFIFPEIPPTQTGKTPELKIRAALNVHSLFNIEEGVMEEIIEETVEIEEKPEPPKAAPKKETPPPKETSNPAPTTTPASNETPASTPTEPMQTDATPASPKPEPPKKRTEVRKRTHRKTLRLVSETYSMPLSLIQKFMQDEGVMAAADKLVIETAEAKNAVESYTYSMRDKISTTLAKYFKPEEARNFTRMLEEVNDWLYSFDEPPTKSVFLEKLKQLKAIGDPAERNKQEFEGRPSALSQLEATLSNFSGLAASTDEKYSHITKEERDKVLGHCGDIRKWIDTEVAKQKALALYDAPSLTVSMINAKKTELFNQCNAIMSKPKPKPTPPKTEEKPATAEPPPMPQTQTPPPTTSQPQNQPPPQSPSPTPNGTPAPSPSPKSNLQMDLD
ncbi:heat-shock protein 70 [Pelomyxa schiedti]|nr:heat-shock protein 70 [Pelomyxa schiedti]